MTFYKFHFEIYIEIILYLLQKYFIFYNISLYYFLFNFTIFPFITVFLDLLFIIKINLFFIQKKQKKRKILFKINLKINNQRAKRLLLAKRNKFLIKFYELKMSYNIS